VIMLRRNFGVAGRVRCSTPTSRDPVRKPDLAWCDGDALIASVCSAYSRTAISNGMPAAGADGLSIARGPRAGCGLVQQTPTSVDGRDRHGADDDDADLRPRGAVGLAIRCGGHSCSSKRSNSMLVRDTPATSSARRRLRSVVSASPERSELWCFRARSGFLDRGGVRNDGVGDVWSPSGGSGFAVSATR